MTPSEFDAADALDHLARYGLVVCDDGQGFERRLGQLLRVPAQHIGFDHVVVSGVREQRQPPATSRS